MLKIAVIGGGAAGFFAAIQVKTNFPSADVVIFEKTTKLLSKVKISGGGRCNVTNGCTSISSLVSGYPRGQNQLKKAFREFNNLDTIKWFEAKGVPLYTQEDNRVFPKSDDSQSIVDCLINEARKLDIEIRIKCPVTRIAQVADRIELSIKDQTERSVLFDKVIVATGGTPKSSGFNWLRDLGHEIVEPVPSLFTLNMPENSITELQGVVIQNSIVSLQGTKLKSFGPVLITHWGLSGPAILKLSSFGSRTLSELNYNFTILINWVNIQNHEDVANELKHIASKNPKKQMGNVRPFDLPSRFWLFQLKNTQIPSTKNWEDLGKKSINRLVARLTSDEYAINGKTTFKEEFVTSGGISLSSFDFDTMQSKSCPGLYFAGEVIDIDGITGGYNFQAAWTTAYIAGQLKG